MLGAEGKRLVGTLPHVSKSDETRGGYVSAQKSRTAQSTFGQKWQATTWFNHMTARGQDSSRSLTF